MHKLRLLVCIMAILGVSLVSTAEEKKFKDEAEISVVDKTGNTDTTDVNIKNLMWYQFTEKVDGSWKVAIGYGQTDGDKTAENYLTEFKGNYALNDRFYASALLGWERDEFSGIDQRYYIGPALGYKFYTGPKHFLIAEAGAQYVKEDYTDDTDDNFLEGRVFGAYKYQFTEKSAFKQEIELLNDFNDSEKFKVNSITSVTAALNSWLYMKTSYEINYNNDPTGDNIQKTDKVLSATLGINF